MKRKDWNPRTSTERRFFERINRLTRTVRKIANTYNSVAEITAAISAITEMPEWQAIALSEAMKMVRSVATQNSSNWREAARQAGGRKSFQIFQALNQELSNHEKYKAIIRRNAELISNMPDDIARKITEHTATQAVRGLRAEALLEDIREFAPHVSETRARLIARTEVAKTNAAITEIHAQQAGINFYVWQTSQDARVRSSHKHMQGVVCTYNSPPSPEQLNGEPSVGYYGPGEIWNCLAEETPVYSLVPYEKLYRRRYSGEIVEIFTASKQTGTRITPNHPVLTSKGWINAGLLNEGDDILYIPIHQLGIFESNPNDSIANFGELFSFFSVLFDTQRGSTSEKDFHGDASIDHQVDVISLEGILRHHVQPNLCQALIEQIFHRADSFEKLGIATSDSRFLYYFPIFRFSPDSILSSFTQAFSLFFGSESHSGKHSLAAITWLDSLAKKIFLDYRSGNVEMLSNSFNADTGIKHRYCLLFLEILFVVWRSLVMNKDVPTAAEVDGEIVWSDPNFSGYFTKVGPLNIEPDRIIKKIVSKDFSGHIYNLQTSCGWYVSGDYITKNCRCFASPIINPDFESWPKKVVRNGRIVRMSKKEFMEFA